MKNHCVFQTNAKVRIIDEDSRYHNQVGIITDHSKHSLKVVVQFANGDKRSFLKNRLTSYLSPKELSQLEMIHHEMLIDMSLQKGDRTWFEELMKLKPIPKKEL
ncbi:hypothetical protein CN918_31230 [Priestia megaterium]|nr:hypothetical protein CN918_31230 [Priestia megaterium]